jgi:two-component system phosphate regulon sensor histidine kinase PhoR
MPSWLPHRRFRRTGTDARSTEARILAAVLDGMAEGVWITDAEGRIRRHNQALTGMLPKGARIVGQGPLALLRSPELNEAVKNACERGATTGMEVTLEEAGTPRILAVQVMPLGSGLPGSAAVFRDVTELRKLEKVRKDFVSNVSHELRTPITAIRGYAETLKGGALSDPQHAPRMVDVILRQSERLSHLVSDLLDLSRLESGDLTLARARVSLSEVVSRALDVVGPRAANRGQAVTLEVPEALLAIGDPHALEHVVLNLLDNAVKYTPDGGRILVQGRREGAVCILTVADSGPGMDARHLPRIFERFYRVDKGRSRETGGTGLGLAIVKHLLVAMGGEVRVESEPGKGSRFTVAVPAA